jgi:BlaI family penicillinase repressor
VSDTPTLTELQLAILAILWERGEGTTQEVHEALKDERGLALTTVATLLTRLEKKGVLAHRKDGRQHVYRATVTRRDVRRSKVRELTETLFDGDAAALVSHLVDPRTVSAEDLDRIRTLIRDAEAHSGTPGGADRGS